MKAELMTPGERLGKLTLLRIVDAPKFNKRRDPWGEFACDCGNVKRILIYSVTSGRCRACGCEIGTWWKGLTKARVAADEAKRGKR